MNWHHIWIAGNGPSASTFDLSAEKNVLVLNDGLFRVPNAGALFSLDVTWIRKNKAAIIAFKGEKYLALPHFALPDLMDIPDVRYYLWGNQDGLSLNEGVLNTGCNSGYAAINLAFQKGSTTINLIGYDMNSSENSQYRFWTQIFRTMKPQLAQRGVTVLNHNINSAIDAFTRVEG